MKSRAIGIGTWKDSYSFRGHELTEQYQVKIYETESDLQRYSEKHSLRLESIVEEYNVVAGGFEPGWIDYVFQKQ